MGAVGWLVLVVGCGALVYAVRRVRRRAGRGLAVGTVLARDVLSLPDETLDPGPLHAKMRRRLGYSVLLLGCWVAFGVFSAMLFVMQARDAQWLLDHGARTTATVTAVHHPSRGMPSIEVEFSRRTVVIHGYEPYSVGDAVEVFYDPADPGRVRTADMANRDPLTIVGCVLVAVAAGAGLLAQGRRVLGWRRWFRSVADAGWRRAVLSTADVPGAPPSLLVTFPNGAVLKARGSRVGEQPVVAGGRPPHLVVVPAEGRLLRLTTRVSRVGRSG
ncbi:DUF3592 domain-containing protein [Saccharothrix obliqua]|uniref:DUF3592 domain-containing protein n=1 Tax=Saccharothrix obliqua TaxID=2861747 RepID=UPI001C5F13C4|nr:DUF3592 domain-containing protein [Saccharothrix obliqua]MBW4718886.1 DUF3592 domain-containing protein [Saccharothrix obliqua]